MNLSGFRKISEDSKTAVLKHPKGHRITIAKNALSPQLRSQLSSLPMKMADGGMADDEDNLLDSIASPEVGDNRNDTGTASRPPSDEEVAREKQNRYFPNGTFNEKNAILDMKSDSPEVLESQSKILARPRAADESEKASLLDDYKDRVAAVKLYNVEAKKSGLPEKPLPEPPGSDQPINLNPHETYNAPATAPVSTAANVPAQAPVPGVAIPGLESMGVQGQGINQQIAGIQGQANAESDAGKKASALYGNAVNDRQNDLNAFQQNTQKFQQDHAAFMHDLAAKHIDPDRYLKSQSTGGKIMTAIGLLLGGFAPATGQNSAVKMLTDDINRDVDAQKQDIKTADDLLQANFRYYGEMRQAAEMTKIQKLEMLQYKLNEVAAQSQDPLAQARKDQAVGVIKQQIGTQMNQLAASKTLIDRMNSQSGGQSSGPNSAQNLMQLHQLGRLTDDDYKESMKELGQKQKDDELQKYALRSFDQIHSKFMNGVFSPADVASAKQAFIGKIIKESEGRYNFEAAQNLADAIFPRKMESGETSGNKRERIVQLMGTLSSYPHLEALGLASGGSEGSKIQEFAPRLK